MGSRADFYVGRGSEAEWIGSVAYDGYPAGLPPAVLEATTEADFREQVALMLHRSNDGTTPDQGWPWPWGNAYTTDRSYCFDAGRVWPFKWGIPIPEGMTDDEFTQEIYLQHQEAPFPAMDPARAAPGGHPRSGIIALSLDPQ